MDQVYLSTDETNVQSKVSNARLTHIEDVRCIPKLHGKISL